MTDADAVSSAPLSVVTIGCHDFDAIRAFYTALGWPDAHPLNSPTPSDGASDGWISFRTAGGILALWGDDLLARESGFDAPPPPNNGFRGLTLAANLDSEGRRRHPARARRHPSRLGWLLRLLPHPEGNTWEVAYNPNAQFDQRGALLGL